MSPEGRPLRPLGERDRAEATRLLLTRTSEANMPGAKMTLVSHR